MLYSYFRSTLRNLWKRKAFTFINLAGLTIGLAGFLLILQYIFYEYSYDTFHTKADRIYRVRYDVWQNGKKTIECAAAVPAVGPAMRDNFPEVVEYARLFPAGGVLMYERPDGTVISIREEKMQIATPSVLDIFSFELLEGNPATALEGPDKVVISERAAKKYFGDEDPMGKSISLNGIGEGADLKVTGVMANVPDNSHIKFDILISFQSLSDRSDNQSETSWGWYDFNTYVLLDEGAEPSAFQAKWDAWLESEKKEEWEKRNYRAAFTLQPLTSIHLYSNLLQESEPEEQGDGDVVNFLVIIAAFILLIAWVNYINLSTSRAVERANEVGVRKAMGANRAQLVKQFLAEALTLNLVAAVFAILFVSISLPYFQELTGKPLSFAAFSETWFWIALPLAFLVGALASGWYPALVLSAYKPLQAIRNRTTTGSVSGTLMRKGLVVFQFMATIMLVAGTITVYRQLQFMFDQDLGFNMNSTLVIKAPESVDSTYSEQFRTFKNEMFQSNAQIASITAASNVPGDEIFWTRGIKRLKGGPAAHIVTYNVGMDYDYVPSFDIELLAGRNFSEGFPSDNEAVILNKATIDVLEYENVEDAIGDLVITGGDTMQIVGVLDNYHQMSLKNTQVPIVFRLYPDVRSFYAIKLSAGEFRTVMADLQEKWNAFFPGNPFDYFYLDAFYNKQYDSDARFSKVFTLFAGLAIFIACLGLFGLSSYTALQRTKEIGVRKVLGSSIAGIFILLSKDFIKLIIVAIILGVAPAWLLLDQWLETFPYHIKNQWDVFVLAGFIVLCIALFTVSFQTLKAATLNPVKALRDE